jgi:hypothetical protein
MRPLREESLVMRSAMLLDFRIGIRGDVRRGWRCPRARSVGTKVSFFRRHNSSLGDTLVGSLPTGFQLSQRTEEFGKKQPGTYFVGCEV